MSQEELARRAGLDRHRISELERGQKSICDMAFGRVVRLANALEVPLTLFGDAGGADWDIVSWRQVDRIQEYLREIGEAGSSLVWTHGIDSYLVPDGFVEWSERSRLERLGWKPKEITARLRCWSEYVAAQRVVRARSDCLHRIICPAHFLRGAFVVQPEWAGCVRRTLEMYGEVTAVGLVRPGSWEDASRYLDGMTEWSRCDKICVTENLAMVRPTRELFCFTRRPAEIERLAFALESLAMAYVQYSFPKSDCLAPTAFTEASEKAVDELLRVAGNTPPR